MQAGPASYEALHKRLRKARGKAIEHQCVRCPSQAIQWAQVHGEDGTDVWTDYVPMCISCHLRYDYTEDRRALVRQAISVRTRNNAGQVV